MTRLRDVADALATGAEALYEFDEWVASGGFETFGEWLLGRACPEAEKPPIVTPPPPQETPEQARERLRADPTSPLNRSRPRSSYDPYKAANAALRVLHQSLRMRDVDYRYDVINEQVIFRCCRCGEQLKVERLHLIDVGRVSDAPVHVYGQKVGAWYHCHGPNCGRVDIERGEWRPE